MKIKSPAVILLAVILMAAVLAGLTFVLEVSTIKTLFSEQGIFEQLSPVVWIAAALYSLRAFSRGGTGYLVLALTFIISAAREWDLHKAFTRDSFLKSNFYENSIGPEQVFGGIAALVIFGLILASVVILVRYILIRRGYRHPGGQLLMAGLSLLVLTKILDRAPAILRNDLEIILPEPLLLVLRAWEEGFEFFCPVLILLGIVCKYRDEKSRKIDGQVSGSEAGVSPSPLR